MDCVSSFICGMKRFVLIFYRIVIKNILHTMFDFLLIHGKFNINKFVVVIFKMRICEILGE